MLLLLSFKGSLRKWHREGILSREIELYVAYVRHGVFEQIDIFSYDPDDAGALALIDCTDAERARLRVIVPSKGQRGLAGSIAYSLSPMVGKRLAKAGYDIVKTNQINGGWRAFALTRAGVPLLARCGYLLSRRFDKNGQPVRAAVARMIENALFRRARAVSVTTAGAKSDVEARVGTDRPVFVAPTYVNTSLFNSNAADKQPGHEVVYVGRLEPQKNILAIVEACQAAGVALRIIGDGSLRAQVEQHAAAIGATVSITARMQNTDIADLYRTQRYYILASLHEGLPKALIEAMSAEMIVIGTPIPGIVDLVQDGVTGYLSASTAAADIASTIRRAVESGDAGIAIAQAARRLVLERHSLESYVALEAGYIRGVVRRK
jgi:glycosyltransferase involved in cell wall biosynthesis